MQVPVETEAKKKAVKQKPLKIDTVEDGLKDHTPHCYFSEEHPIDETQANMTKVMLGHSVCASCTCKLIAIVSYAGMRDIV